MAISCDVAQAPYCLFNDLNMRGIEQINEHIDGTLLNEDLYMITLTAGNVGQAPCCLKLRFIEIRSIYLELWQVSS